MSMTKVHRISVSDDGIHESPLMSPVSTTDAVLVEPDTEVDDDDEVMDNVGQRSLSSIPRQFALRPSEDALSSSSSLSDASVGLLPDECHNAHGETDKNNKSTSALPETQMSHARRGELKGEEEGEKTGESPSKTPLMAMGTQHTALDPMDASSTGGSLIGHSSLNSSNDFGYGWYEDVHTSEHASALVRGASYSPSFFRRKGDDKVTTTKQRKPLRDDLRMIYPDAAAMAVTAPNYVLEESLSSQKLWKHTAGQRPPQPVEERAFYEKMWSQNFARSQVKYNIPPEILTAASPIALSPFAEGDQQYESVGVGTNDYIATQAPTTTDQGGVAEATLMSLMNDPGLHPDDRGRVVASHLPRTVKGQDSEGDLTILVRGVNAFGTTVSKSFIRPSERGGGIDTINISIASYRVVESKTRGKYAQFLVIYREGSIRDTVGVWKRYRDFEELARTITQAHDGCAGVLANVSPLAVAEEPDTEHLPNAITSWRLLKKRQRWFRCLDAGYLSLKVFLLERFLHDILFESTSPKLLREFIGAGMS